MTNDAKEQVEALLEEAREWCRVKVQTDITRGETATAEELLDHLEELAKSVKEPVAV